MAQAMRKSTPAVETTALPEERKLPVVNPRFVQIQSEGHVYRSLVARLPEDAISDDLRTPSIWRKVQLTPMIALQKHDRVYCIGYAEDWACDAVVVHADGNEAWIATQRLISFEGHGKPLFRDENYEVFWAGDGYGVRRLSDKQSMGGGTFANVALAEHQLRSLYPKSVA